MASIRAAKSASSLKKQAEGWLSSEGYPLEMRVARTFRRMGFPNVYQGMNYRDETENKWRENDLTTLDVVESGWNDIRLVVRCVVECTYSTSRPWVVFPITEAGGFSYALTWRARCWTKASEFLGDAIEEEGLAKDTDPPALLEFHEPVAYGVVQAGRRDAREGKGNGTSANAKVAQLLSAVRAMRKVAGTDSWELLLPVLVIGGELFATRLRRDGSVHALSTRGEATLVVDRYDFDEAPVAVHLVTERALSHFCKRVREGIAELRPRLGSLVQAAARLANERAIGQLK